MRFVLTIVAAFALSGAAFGQDCPNGQCAVGSRPMASAARNTLAVATHPVAAVRQFQPVRKILGIERRHDRRAARSMLVR